MAHEPDDFMQGLNATGCSESINESENPSGTHWSGPKCKIAVFEHFKNIANNARSYNGR